MKIIDALKSYLTHPVFRYLPLIHWDAISCLLLDGHPTRSQLEAGKGKRGGPVSEHNVWCDKACGYAAVGFIEKL